MKTSCRLHLWKFMNNPVLLFSLFILSVIICFWIECKFMTSDTWKNILLAISYGYISSSIFYFFVNVCPNKYEKYLMEEWVKNMLYTIREDLRQTKAIIINPFSFEEEPKDEESYVNKFGAFNFEKENAPFNNKQKAIERLNEYRHTINDNISLLLHFRVLLSEEQEEFVAEVAKSHFLTEYLRPNREGSSLYDSNQENIGRSIYKLYEKAIELSK